MKRIIIDGGSYNPVHDAHIFMKDEAYEHIAPDEVWMWLSHNPFKNANDYAPKDARMEMCMNVVGNRSWLHVTDLESNFHDTKTASSLTILKEMFPNTEFIWAFGDDNFASFHTWDDERFLTDGKIVPDWQYIMHEFSLAVMHRPGERTASMNSIAAQYAHNMIIDNPKLLSTHEQRGVSFIDNKTYPHSSTNVRAALSRQDKNIAGLHPANEQLIYDQGLFGIREQFNNQPLAQQTNNEVRFQTFIVLANTINLIKSLWVSDLLMTDPAEYSAHFRASWDKSVAKGDLKKYEDVPGEIADCLISLCWVASHNRIQLPSIGTGSETQSSVNQWCESHFPNRSMKQKLMDYIEELAELCVCEGLEKHRATAIITQIFHADDLRKPVQAISSNFQVLHNYADDLGMNLSTILDDKMKINRQRSLEQSAAREATKRTQMTRGLK